MDITHFLKTMIDRGASDLFFSVGAPPTIKIEGVNAPIGDKPLTGENMVEMSTSIMSDAQLREFEETMELNMAVSLQDKGRFRVNIFRQRGEVAMVVRYIKGVIPSLENLNLPALLSTIVMEPRGLVLVVGATSSGKSTTLASMIDHRNNHHRGHILTIEDPIEYVHHHKQSIVDQREIGIDTKDFDSALKNAMREAPDVILIGEIRDKSTMKHAISYAETGHLCLATLHANNASQAMDRVINFFSEDAKQQLLLDLSLNLRAIVSQRLVPGIGNTRLPAVEILICTPLISSLIEKGKIEEIKEAMAKGREQGMQTFDQSLFDLYTASKITKEDAIRFADSRNNVALSIRLSEEGNLDGDSDLTIVPDDMGRG